MVYLDQKLNETPTKGADTMKNTINQKEVKHTPTPWKVKNYNGNNKFRIVGADDSAITNLTGQYLGEEKTNAQFIVKAVNCHDDLVEALKTVLNGTEFMTDEDFINVRQALAKAGA